MDNIPSNPKKINRLPLVPLDWRENVDKSLLTVLSLNREFIRSLNGFVEKVLGQKLIYPRTLLLMRRTT
jgi:hypothetical protein